MNEPPVTFVCVLFQPDHAVPEWGRVYDESWVEKLHCGIARNYDREFDFTVLTDQPEEPYVFDNPGIDVAHLYENRGWGNLAECWRPGLAPGKIVVLGLDTIITGNITEIVDSHGFALLTDPIQTDQVCNGMGIYDVQTRDVLWALWKRDLGSGNPPLLNGKLSEMQFLRNHYRPGLDGLTLLDREFPGRILSYKIHIRNPRLNRKAVKEARIVYFHGRPKPDELMDAHWLARHWNAGCCKEVEA